MRCDFNYVYKVIADVAARPPSMHPDFSFSAECQRILAIINAMTSDERCDSDLLLDLARRERIARDAGVPLAEVNQLVAQRQILATMMTRMSPDGQQGEW